MRLNCSPWIDTNTGFIRSVRAWGPAAVWLGYLPPAHSVVTGERYQAAIADAEMWRVLANNAGVQ